MKRIKTLIRSVVMLFKSEKMIPIPAPINTTELLKDKVALITGGSGGIGLAIAESFLKSGAKVIIAGTSEKKLQDGLRKLDGGANASAIAIDVTDVDALPAKTHEAAQLFLENRIDILVNSAGVVNCHDFLEMSGEEYDRIMDTNAKGTFFMSQAVAKYMIENHVKGHILNTVFFGTLAERHESLHSTFSCYCIIRGGHVKRDSSLINDSSCKNVNSG